MVAAPLSLGVEQRSVCILQECLGIRTVIGVHTNANTHRDMQIVMLDAMGGMQRSEYLVGTQGGVFGVGDFREQYHEFIPTVTADSVRAAYASHQASCNRL
jgi:hypothetical protein